MSILDRALRIGEGKKFKEFQQQVARINDLEAEMELLEDEELSSEFTELRERAANGESLDDLLFEAFALTREAGKRSLGMRHFDVQLIGGMVLHDGSIAEMKTGEDKVQRGWNFGIVDEVDNILIDEARTPLIISGQPEQAADLYYQFAKLAPMLEPGKKPEGYETKSKDWEAPYDYEPDEKHKTVAVTEKGVEKAEKFLGIDNMYLAEHGNLVNHLIQALKAESLYKRDVDYAVIDGEVKIIDEFTGRILEGRRWSEGLHQAVEAKEGVAIQEENQTVATITYQNYFRRYGKLSGMTGTAITEATEFMKIYELQVVEIPTNEPMIRADKNDQIYKTKEGKWNAVLAEIEGRHAKEQPVLVGTISVEVSELLSERLKQRGIPHTVLNAKPEHAAREAEIVAEAGQPGAVTIATNMAGRGVDIKLGGNAEHLSRLELARRGVEASDHDAHERAMKHVLP